MQELRQTLLPVGCEYEAAYEGTIIRFRVTGRARPELRISKFDIMHETVDVIGRRPYIAEAPPSPTFAEALAKHGTVYMAPRLLNTKGS